MEEEPGRNSITFGKFIDGITNKLTCFGIFNALLIYSATIQDLFISQSLTCIFFILSSLLIFSILSDAGKAMEQPSDHIRFEFYIFFFCIGLVAIFLTFYAIQQFPFLKYIVDLLLGIVIFYWTTKISRLFFWREAMVPRKWRVFFYLICLLFTVVLVWFVVHEIYTVIDQSKSLYKVVKP